VIPFLLRLYPVPVLKAVQSDGGVVVGKVQIQIGGVELLSRRDTLAFMILLLHKIVFSCSRHGGRYTVPRAMLGCSLFIFRNTCSALGYCCSSVTAANISSAYFGIPPTLQMQE